MNTPIAPSHPAPCPTGSPAPPPGAAPSRPGQVSAVIVRRSIRGGWAVGIVAKRTYDVVGARCRVSPTQIPLIETPEVSDTGELRHDADTILDKQFTDIVVEGHAYTPRVTASFDAALWVGGFRRDIRVFGQRTAGRGRNGSIVLSTPATVERVQLGWKNAYGGIDRTALARWGDPTLKMAEAAGLGTSPEQSIFAYPRNPRGKGYLIDPTEEALAACELPLLEDPAQLLCGSSLARGDFMHWPSAPLPVSMGWLGYNAFPRTAQLGLLPTPFLERHLPAARFPEVCADIISARCLDPRQPIQKRVHPGLSQGSAVGMRARELQPGAWVRTHNLHRLFATWTWQLPTEAPRVALRLASGRVSQPVPRISTLLLAPDENRVCVVWCAQTNLAEPASEDQLRELRHGVAW